MTMNFQRFSIVLLITYTGTGISLAAIEQIPNSIQDIPNEIKMPGMGATVSLEELCRKNVGEDAVESAKKGQEDLTECITSLINVTSVMEEVGEAESSGKLDEVFKKYCRKLPAIEECMDEFVAVVEECLDEEQRNASQQLNTITRAVFDFVCHNDGDRIAIFLANDGVDCVSDKVDDIQKCVNSTMPDALDGEAEINGKVLDVSTRALKNECKIFDTMQNCIVKHLMTCENDTPANVVESLAKHVRKSTSCVSGCEGVVATSVTLVLVMAVLSFF